MAIRKKTQAPIWDDSYYVKIYRLAFNGASDLMIAKNMGVSLNAFRKWIEEKPAVADALDQGRKSRRGSDGFKEFMRHVSEKIPASLKSLWEKLSSPNEEVRQDTITDEKEYTTRKVQRLFIHAFIAMNFDRAAACRAVGIDFGKLISWKTKDKKFKKLYDFLVTEAKGDFYESALLDLVAVRDSSAVIFANRTFNKDRGYGNQLTVKMQGEVEHKHSVPLKELSQETKRKMLEEIRSKKLALEDRTSGKVIDAEFVVKSKTAE